MTIIQDQITDWLNTMRMGDGGFIATVDTIVALEALVTYSYNNRQDTRRTILYTLGMSMPGEYSYSSLLLFESAY